MFNVFSKKSSDVASSSTLGSAVPQNDEQMPAAQPSALAAFKQSPGLRVLENAELGATIGGKSAELRTFTTFFSWNSACGGPVPN